MSAFATSCARWAAISSLLITPFAAALPSSSPGSVDPTNPKCVRSSAGALFATLVGAVEDLATLRALGLNTIGAAAGGAGPDEVDLTGPVALVFGGEAAGLPEDQLVDQEVALPLEGGVESLNVAMAATVLLYEARRQRNGGAW